MWIFAFYKNATSYQYVAIMEQDLASKLYSSNLCKEVFHMTVPQVEHKGKHITGKFLEQPAISRQPF
jgi:hypothetical protein